MYKKLPTHRYKKTLEMLKEVCPAPAVIFDLGVRNPFSEIMKQNNYKVYNTVGAVSYTHLTLPTICSV